MASSPGSAVEPTRHYRVFGLDFGLNEEAPGLGQMFEASADEIPIEIGRVPARLGTVETVDDHFEANADELLFAYGPLRMLARHGEAVFAERVAQAHPAFFWYNLWIMASALIGFQRGHFPLHASAVASGGSCHAFAGPSGAGKSTLLSGLIRRGYAMVADDLCLIRSEGPDRRGRVGSGPLELRLTPDALAQGTLDVSSAEHTFACSWKSGYRLGTARPQDFAMGRIYAIAFESADAEPGIVRASPLQAMQVLMSNNRLGLRLDRLPMALRDRTFKMLVRLARELDIYRFVRPRDHRRFDQWTDYLVDHMRRASDPGDSDPI